MISLPRRTTLVLGAVSLTMVASAPVLAGDLLEAANRCAVYGGGFVELGNGTCGRVRVGDTAQGSEWRGANAGLRSDGYGMLPGAGNARHLRIQADPDFR